MNEQHSQDRGEPQRPERPTAGGGIAYDKHGNAFTNGDKVRGADGRIYKVHGLGVESQPGTFAAYARDVEKVPDNTPWTDSAAGLPPTRAQTILWGS